MGLWGKIKKGTGKLGKAAGYITGGVAGVGAGIAGAAADAALPGSGRSIKWAEKTHKGLTKAGETIGRALPAAAVGAVVGGPAGAMAGGLGSMAAERGASINKKLAAEQAVKATPTTTPSTTPVASPTIAAPAPIKSLADTEFIPEEMKKALAAREAGLAGFSSPELAAQRSQMALAQGAAEKGRERALAASLARSGVRGGAAAAATGRAAQMAAQERAAQEQELFLRDVAQKQQALKDYEGTVGGAMGAAGRERFMGLAADIAGEQLASTERIAGRGAEAIEKYGQAMAPQPGQENKPGLLRNLTTGLFGEGGLW